MGRLSRTLCAVCVAALLCTHARPSRVPTAAHAEVAAEGQSQLPTLKASNVLEEVRRRKASRPALSASALARYGNELLARRGFDYDFNVCELFPPGALTRGGGMRPDGTRTPVTLEHRMTRADGREVGFKLVTDDRGGMCGECFVTLAALRVTKGEMTAVVDGVTYVLKRPAAFALDEAHLVADDLKTVLRTWQLPYQTIPAGVSPDGRSLYLSFYEDAGLDELVLEITEDGRSRFRAAREAGAKGGERVTEHPKDPSDDYLSFMRFRSGGRTHVVRFSGPCT
ncbi:MAG: hypothetical protein ABW250_18455 [Pyrinomonadaceae bacterium]